MNELCILQDDVPSFPDAQVHTDPFHAALSDASRQGRSLYACNKAVTDVYRKHYV